MDECDPSPERAADTAPLYSFILGYDGGNSDEDVMDLSDYDSSSDEGFGFLGGASITNEKAQNRESHIHSPAVTEIATTTHNSCVTTKPSDLNSQAPMSAFEPAETTEPTHASQNSSFKPIHIQHQPTTNVSTLVTFNSVTVPARMPSITVLSGALISNVTGSPMKNHVRPSFPECSTNQMPSSKQSQFNIVKDSQSVTASLDLISGALPAETTETINSDSVIKKHKSFITSTIHNSTTTKDCSSTASVSLLSTDIVIDLIPCVLANEKKLGDDPKKDTTFLGQTGNADNTCGVSMTGLDKQSQRKVQVDQNIVERRWLDQTLNSSEPFKHRLQEGSYASVGRTSRSAFCHQPICTIISSPTKPHGGLHETSSVNKEETSSVNKEQIVVKSLSKLQKVSKDVKRLHLHKSWKPIPTIDKNSKDFSAFIWPTYDKDGNSCTEIDARLNIQRPKKEAKYSRPKQIMFNPTPVYKRHIFYFFSEDPRMRMFSKTRSDYGHSGTKKLNSDAMQRNIFSPSLFTNKPENPNLQQHGYHQAEKGIIRNNIEQNDRLRVDGEMEFTLSSKTLSTNPLLGPFPKLLEKSVDNPNSSLVNSIDKQSIVSESLKHRTIMSLDAVSPEKKYKDNSHHILHHNETESQLKKPRENSEHTPHNESKKRRISSKKPDFLMNLHESFMKNTFSTSKSGRDDESHKPVSRDKEQQRIGNFSTVHKHDRDKHSYRRVCKKEKRNVLDYHLCSRCMVDRTVAKIQPPAMKIKSSACLKCRKKLSPKDLMCKLCRQSFPNMMIYAGHVYNLLSSVKEYRHFVCCKCKESFPSRFTFHTHLAQPGCANICLNCDRLFRSHSSLIEHSCVSERVPEIC